MHGYCLDDPVNMVDPVGLAGIAAIMAGDMALGANKGLPGHLSVQVDPDPNFYGFRPADSVQARRDGWWDTPGKMSKETKQPDVVARYKTTPAEDAKMRQRINKVKSNPGDYNIYDKNCVTTGADVVDGVLHTPPAVGNTPYGFQRQTKELNKGRVKK